MSTEIVDNFSPCTRAQHLRVALLHHVDNQQEFVQA
jgi:hypothetical protein